MAKITETGFAANAVKLWHLLNDLDALKTKLKERGLWRTLRAGNQHDKKLIREYFRTRNAASAIVNSIGVHIEH
jgi:hypothetical protein